VPIPAGFAGVGIFVRFDQSTSAAVSSRAKRSRGVMLASEPAAEGDPLFALYEGPTLGLSLPWAKPKEGTLVFIVYSEGLARAPGRGSPDTIAPK